MTAGFVTNDLKQRTLDSINEQADNAYQKMLEKKEIYQKAMKTYNIFKNQKEIAFRTMLENRGTSRQEETRIKYQTVAKSLFEAESDSDILRDSLRNSISFCSKMTESAFIANSILG